MTRHLAIALLASFAALAASSASAQVEDHRWTPNNSGFSNGLVATPGLAPGSAGTSTTVTTGCGSACDPQPPEPPKPTGAWTYMFNGHQENTCTAGASVFEFALGCYDGLTKVADSQCPDYGKPPYATCKWWPLQNGQGNCPTGYPIVYGGSAVTQTYEYASVSFMYDWRGTCYPSTITPYR